ncbi:TPA: hypothetical protein QHZ98_003828 [Klebsiella oxytoca]|nr:hypothetical protein [Klebsiella oxytoca]
MTINVELCEKILQRLYDKFGEGNYTSNKSYFEEITESKENYIDHISHLKGRELIIVYETIDLVSGEKNYHPKLTEKGRDKIKKFGVNGVLKNPPSGE